MLLSGPLSECCFGAVTAGDLCNIQQPRRLGNSLGGLVAMKFCPIFKSRLFYTFSLSHFGAWNKGYNSLEPKWPLFWLEFGPSFGGLVQPPKQRTFTGSRYVVPKTTFKVGVLGWVSLGFFCQIIFHSHYQPPRSEPSWRRFQTKPRLVYLKRLEVKGKPKAPSPPKKTAYYMAMHQ